MSSSVCFTLPPTFLPPSCLPLSPLLSLSRVLFLSLALSASLFLFFYPFSVTSTTDGLRASIAFFLPKPWGCSSVPPLLLERCFGKNNLGQLQWESGSCQSLVQKWACDQFWPKRHEKYQLRVSLW